MYHVTHNGEYGKCKAQVGNCPYSEDSRTIHVDKKSEAISESCKILQKQYKDFSNLHLQRKKQ